MTRSSDAGHCGIHISPSSNITPTFSSCCASGAAVPANAILECAVSVPLVLDTAESFTEDFTELLY